MNEDNAVIRDDEIKKREEILNKAYRNEKISSEEREWLITHSLYNSKFGINTYNVAVEEIPSNMWCALKVKVESVSYDNRIIPVIFVPGAKAQIIVDVEVSDLYGKLKKPGTPVKMLGLENCEIGREYVLRCRSALGKLSVEYQCDYFDTKMCLNKREASSTGNYSFAMKREVVDEHTVRYMCKSPTEDTFDALVFSVRWESIEVR